MSDTRHAHDDPPWVDQRLDDGYWDDREYRLEYMNWLGEVRTDDRSGTRTG